MTLTPGQIAAVEARAMEEATRAINAAVDRLHEVGIEPTEKLIKAICDDQEFPRALERFEQDVKAGQYAAEHFSPTPARKKLFGLF